VFNRSTDEDNVFQMDDVEHTVTVTAPQEDLHRKSRELFALLAHTPAAQDAFAGAAASGISGRRHSQHSAAVSAAAYNVPARMATSSRPSMHTYSHSAVSLTEISRSLRNMLKIEAH